MTDEELLRPTTARPGSDEKKLVMMQRLERGLPIHIPGDFREPSEYGAHSGAFHFNEVDEPAAEEA